jgi:hypothetical protein
LELKDQSKVSWSLYLTWSREVMDWICKFLEHNEFSNEELERVRNTVKLNKQKGNIIFERKLIQVAKKSKK